MKKMDFDMKTGERLKVSKGFVKVYEVDGGVRYYSLKGELLNRFLKEQLEMQSQPTLICMKDCILTQKDNYWYVLTYRGVEICKFEATDLEEYKTYVVLKNEKEMRLYDTEKRKFIGENFDKIWRWGETFVLKKDEMHYLYNVESKKIEGKFQIYTIEEYTRRKNFILLYYRNKCGLWIEEKYNEKFFNALPIEYQKIKIMDNEILAIKNGKEEHYPLEVSKIKKKKYHTNKNVQMQSDYQINFLNCIRVSLGEELTLNEKFILVTGDLTEERRCKYYTLQGKYIGESGLIKNEFGELIGESYIETENLLAIGGEIVLPFGRSRDWKLYDYEGNELFGKSFEFEQRREYYLATPSSCSENITYVFSNKGKLLFTLDNSEKILEVADKYFEILDNENKIWFLNDKGKAIFDKGIEKDIMVNLYNGFVGEKNENGYNIFDCNHGKIYYVKADSIENMDFLSTLNIFFRVVYKEKQGVILLKSKGYEFIVPTEYLEVKKHDEFILAKAEEWDDIYSLDGTLIMSTK